MLNALQINQKIIPYRPFHRETGGGALQLPLYGTCGHRIGELTHPQTKAGPLINKNTSILRLFTT